VSEATEEAVWNAVRSIQETSMLMSHLADHWRQSDPEMAEEFVRKAKAAQDRADNISWGRLRERRAQRGTGEGCRQIAVAWHGLWRPVACRG
jgi:hypothetical protein